MWGNRRFLPHIERAKRADVPAAAGGTRRVPVPKKDTRRCHFLAGRVWGNAALPGLRPGKPNEFAAQTRIAQRPPPNEGRGRVWGKRSIARAFPWQANEFAAQTRIAQRPPPKGGRGRVWGNRRFLPHIERSGSPARRRRHLAQPNAWHQAAKKAPFQVPFLAWRPLRESNPQLTLRRGLLYPFN